MTTCQICHINPALSQFWIDREVGFQLVCPACQTPQQRALSVAPRPAA